MRRPSWKIVFAVFLTSALAVFSLGEISVLGKRIYAPGVIDKNTYVYELVYSSGTYSVYMNDSLIDSLPSTSRPDFIGFGHPPASYIPWESPGLWTAFKMDRVSVNGAYFSDDFDGTEIDASKWVAVENTDMSGNPAYGGNITVADGYVFLSSDGSSFPYISSTVNPFPTTGDFVLEFDLTYTTVTGSGTGFWVSTGEYIVYVGGYPANILHVWQDSGGGYGDPPGLRIHLLADEYPETPPSEAVGGKAGSVDKFALLAPYIGLASTIIVATAATAIYVKHVKRREKKQ